MRRRPFVISILIICLLSVGARGGSASASGVGTEAVFNNPNGAAAEQDAIVNKVIDLIHGAGDGSLIRMAMFYWDDDRIPAALAEASRANVRVQVVVSSGMSTDRAAHWNVLASALGTDLSKPSWILECPPGRGCVGNRTLGTVTSINHNKFFLFSSTGGTPDVVVQSSANLHVGRDGTKGWNNALILTGNDGIYNAYSRYFDALKTPPAQQPAAWKDNYYDSGQAPVTSGNAKIHFYPRKESNGLPYSDPSEDTIATVLDHIECKGNSVVGTGDGTHRTIIRVATMIFSRAYLAQKLWDLDNQGCYVQVIDSYNPSSAGEVSAMSKLLAATGSSYGGPIVYYFCVTSDPNVDRQWVHSKYLTVEGKYYGVPDRKIVWTGSHNLSTNSLRQSDEAMLQVEDDTVFGAYSGNFQAMKNASAATGVPRPTTNGRSTAGLCPAA
ncbi:MAG: hypothetical protein JWQ95_3665 [Sphaerisporangium sp.]|nr:hypothetical protein [Sphaerisporangium sp.]